MQLYIRELNIDMGQLFHIIDHRINKNAEFVRLNLGNGQIIVLKSFATIDKLGQISGSGERVIAEKANNLLEKLEKSHLYFGQLLQNAVDTIAMVSEEPMEVKIGKNRFSKFKKFLSRFHIL